MHILPCSSKVERMRRKIEILWLATNWKMRLGGVGGVGWEGHPLIDSDWLNPPGFSVGGGGAELTSWWLRFKLVSVDFWPLYPLPQFTQQNNLTDVSANAFHLSKASPKPFNSQTSKSLHSSPRFGSQIESLNPSRFVGPAQVYSLRPYSLELILKRPSTCPMCTRPTWLGPSCKWDRLPYRAIEVHRDVSVQPYSGWREKVYLTPGCLAVLLVSRSQHSLILLQWSFICCADQINHFSVKFHQ